MRALRRRRDGARLGGRDDRSPGRRLDRLLPRHLRALGVLLERALRRGGQRRHLHASRRRRVRPRRRRREPRRRLAPSSEAPQRLRQPRVPLRASLACHLFLILGEVQKPRHRVGGDGTVADGFGGFERPAPRRGMVVANPGGDAIRRQSGLGVAAREGGFAVEDPGVVGGVVEGERGAARGASESGVAGGERGFRRQQVRANFLGGGRGHGGRARGGVRARAAPRVV